jgi:hypothetical protein
VAAVAARYATDTFVMQLASGANHGVTKGSLRDSLHPAVVAAPALFTTTAPVAGKEIDGKMAGRLASYPAGTEF